jgi:hypothetical protein
MTILQLMAPREGLEGEEEAKKEEDVLVTDDKEVTEVPAKAEEKPAEPAPTEAKMPADAKPEKAVAKAAPIITTDEEFEMLKAQLMQ